MGLLRHSQEQEGDDKPGSQKDSNSAGEFLAVTGVGGGNTEARVKEGREGHPETAVASESGRAEGVSSGELPHSSGELSKTTNEAGHADDSISVRDSTSLDVVHREDESGGGEREEAERTRVAEGPQLRSRVLDVGVTRERTLSSTAALKAVGIGEGTLVVSDGVHGSDG
jgi:hypothetical protein